MRDMHIIHKTLCKAIFFMNAITRAPETTIGMPDLISMLHVAAPMHDMLQGREPMDDLDRIYEINKPDISPDKETLVAYLGPSGAGQDTLVDQLRKSGHDLPVARSATTRKRRVHDDESVDAYMWMDMPVNAPDAVGSLAVKYGLLEVQAISGNYYGLPISSVRETMLLHPGKPLLVKSDPNGLKMLRANASDEFNVIGLAVVPDDYSQLWDRIGSRANQVERMIDCMRFVVETPYITNYVIHNICDPQNPEETIIRNAGQLGALLKMLSHKDAA